jgi:general secretion pathway protein D
VTLATGVADINPPQTAGLLYTIDKANRLSAAFRALANDGRASVLSSPSVLAINGKKSRIQVANQVPIQTASIVANSNPPVTTTTVEYRDVGVILNFTPYINDEGTVTLEIEQEVSDISSTITTTASGNPAFLKRSIQTTLIASADQSIVLGGLVREQKSRNRDGIPFFYKIPLLGWIFGSRSDSFNRNELLIFITPRVIRSVEEGTRLSREFEERVVELKERIGEAKGIRQGRREAPKEPPAQQ